MYNHVANRSSLFTGISISGIRTLQCILLKAALLLGVEVHPCVSFEGLREPPEDQENERMNYSKKYLLVPPNSTDIFASLCVCIEKYLYTYFICPTLQRFWVLGFHNQQTFFLGPKILVLLPDYIVLIEIF